jgi:uncharacterized protein (DUF1778 family)
MKRRDDQITVRIPSTLRKVLEEQAAAESRCMSSLVMKVLVDFAAVRIISRETGAVR